MLFNLKKMTIHEKPKNPIVNFVKIGCLALYATFVSSPYPLLSVIFALPIIWLLPEKSKTTFKQRLSKFADYKIRTVASVLVLTIGITLSVIDYVEFKQESSSSVVVEQADQYNEVSPVTYEIVSIEDESYKALGNKLLSEYTSQEIEDLPLNKRISYNILVSPEIKEAEVVPTIEQIIVDITAEDNDIDEVILFLYSDEELVGDIYDVATAVWAKNGDLGNVDAEIAESNNRTGYELDIDIKDNLEEYLANRAESTEEFGLSEEERREIYKELISAERQATAEADAMYPINDPATIADNLDLNIDLNYELTEKYTAEVLEKYGITYDQSIEISVEAWEEGWPME